MTSLRFSILCPNLFAFVVLFAGALPAQMVSPAIDQPGQPFSYFSKPVDEIGLMGSEGATEITPEGYLRTGYEEMIFFAGPDFTPVSARIRTLEKGYLPIDHFAFVSDGIEYRFTVFEAEVGNSASQNTGKPLSPAALLDKGIGGPIVNFLRVEIRNISNEPNRAVFATGVRYDGPDNLGYWGNDNRYPRPSKGGQPGNYRQIGEEFNREWKNSFDTAHFFRDNRVLYAFPAGYENRAFTLHEQTSDVPEDNLTQPTALHPTPQTPVGIVTYSHLLKPGETLTLDFKQPLVPTTDTATIAAMDTASFDAAREQVVAYWNQLLAPGMQIALPETKPVDTFYTNLIYDLIAIDRIGSNDIQTVNKFHYHAFWLRDSADIEHSYDVTGYPEIALKSIEFAATKQQPDGNFLSQEQQYDGWGQTLWAFGQHYRITHDKQFAEWALPKIDRAVGWLQQARATDPLHILPSSDVRDNENIPGHITGYNFLALAGLQLSIQMANDTGHTEMAQRWQAEQDSLRAAFFKVLDAQAAAHNGYIPPVLDGQAGGYDWGNLLSVVPEPVLDPHDPRVTATLKATQAKYAEGIITYADGTYLHHYLTIKNTMTETIRGDQQQALKEFYALLLHTSSTHAGFEYKIRPWGMRDFGENLSPHGWFAAEYRTLLRTMLVREEGDQLHLLSVISPAWIGKGKTVAVRQAPTNFGPIAFTLDQPSDNEAVLKLDAHFDHAPKRIAIHLPWFMSVKSVTIDGTPLTSFCMGPCPEGTLHMISIPATAQEIRFNWSLRPNTPQLSYEKTVADYKAEYARRYQELMHGGAAAK